MQIPYSYLKCLKSIWFKVVFKAILIMLVEPEYFSMLFLLLKVIVILHIPGMKRCSMDGVMIVFLLEVKKWYNILRIQILKNSTIFWESKLKEMVQNFENPSLYYNVGKYIFGVWCYQQWKQNTVNILY